MEIKTKERFSRTTMLIGQEGNLILDKAKVLVFGVGGVGGFVVEALARAGVGHITIVDMDVVSESNINRQIIADYSTIGQYKVDVMSRRIKSINPDCTVEPLKMYYTPGDSESEAIDFRMFDFIVDAIDTVKSKIDIIKRACDLKVPVISSMGTGNKLDNTAFEIVPIRKTSICPLAKVMRKELKKLGITEVPVLYSKAKPIEVVQGEADLKEAGSTLDEGNLGPRKKMPPGSISYVPATAGLIIAGYVVNQLLYHGCNGLDGLSFTCNNN